MQSAKPASTVRSLDNPFHISPTDNTLAVLDGHETYTMSRENFFAIDYLRLETLLRPPGAEGPLCQRFYTMVPEGKTEAEAPIYRLIDLLHSRGWDIIARGHIEEWIEPGRFRTAGSIKLDIAIEVTKMILEPDPEKRPTHLILWASSFEYVPLIDFARQSGVRVTAVSSTEITRKTGPEMLRRTATQFIELSDLKPLIERARWNNVRDETPSVPATPVTATSFAALRDLLPETPAAAPDPAPEPKPAAVRLSPRRAATAAPEGVPSGLDDQPDVDPLPLSHPMFDSAGPGRRPVDATAASDKPVAAATPDETPRTPEIEEARRAMAALGQASESAAREDPDTARMSLPPQVGRTARSPQQRREAAEHVVVEKRIIDTPRTRVSVHDDFRRHRRI